MTQIRRRLMVVVAIAVVASVSGCRVLESACDLGGEIVLGVAKAALESKLQDLEQVASPEADPSETWGDGPPPTGRTPVSEDRTSDVTRNSRSRRDPGR